MTISVGINDASVAEGDSGTSSLMFTVTLSSASGEAVTVNYATADGTAATGSDYTATSGTLTFAPGETSKSIAIDGLGDTIFESDEWFFLHLFSASGATVADGTGVGTIVNDESQPQLAVGDYTVTEGDSGITNVVFTVNLSTASQEFIFVDFSTLDITAIAGLDYASTSGTLIFAPGRTSASVSVAVTGDITDEANETFSLALTNASGAAISDSSGTATITDNDATPNLSISDASTTEGDALVFTLSLSGASSQTVTVDYSTSDNTAQAGSDYTPTSGTVTFAPGETAKSVTVTTLEDTVVEGSETLRINLSDAAGASIIDSQGLGNILDDDSLPSLSISDVLVTEGNTGTTDLVFTVSLSSASLQSIAVQFATFDGTATGGSDYLMTSGLLVFDPGTTLKTITVQAQGDTAFEPNETFSVHLFNPGAATIANGTGTGAILNDDFQPQLTVGDASGIEGSSGTTTFLFPVMLSNASSQTVTVEYATVNGTATAGSDYTGLSGTLTFAPGQTAKTVSVTVAPDSTFESNETFALTLSSATGATIADDTGVGTISDDDALPFLTVGDATATEGSGLVFTITLSNASSQPVSGTLFSSAGLGATTFLDYIPPVGAVFFSPGETIISVTVASLPDTAFEGSESFFVGVQNVVGAFQAGFGIGTILDDDAAPTISIGDVLVTEGNTGTRDLVFAVNLSNATNQGFAVDYSTFDGTATAGSDYTATSGTLFFFPGQTLNSVTVTASADITFEANENFSVHLFNPAGGTIANGTGTGAILNDDSQPQITIGDLTGIEGSLGTTIFVVPVTLSNASSETVTVDYSTLNGTAMAGSDYTGVSGTLTFAPGQTANSVVVAVAGDTTDEADETFELVLSSAAGATIAVGIATATITDDDITNEAPLAVEDSFDIAEDTPLVVSGAALSGNDTDVNGQSLVVTAVGNATHGTVILAGGIVTFTPSANFNGDAGFEYTISDGTLTDVGTAAVSVAAVNDSPLITSNGGGASATADIAENTTAVTLVAATDVDAVAPLTFSISGADAGAFAINPTSGLLSFISAPNFEAPTDADADNVYAVTVQVSDGVLSDSQAILVTVTDAEDGTPGRDSIAGGAGNDSITGLDGNDSLAGMSGDDTLNGGGGNDTLLGGMGNDVLDGGTGADLMSGSDGDDIYKVDSARDMVREGPDQGIDTVISSITYLLGPEVENATLTGAGNLRLTGNVYDNVLNGNTGANVLNGGLGNDTVNAGAGNDTLVGGEGADVLDGGAGIDRMSGGSGDDVYVVDNAADMVVEMGLDPSTGGVDTVQTAVNWTLGSNIERLILVGSEDINGTGNGLNNQLVGNSGNNVLNGGRGADTLAGGHGNDSLAGGAGADRFVFDADPAATNVDTIIDFSFAGGDRIQFDSGVFSALGAPGVLAGTAFHGAPGAVNATTAGERIVFNTTNGALYYDEDGLGGVSAVQIATIVTPAGLTASGFEVI